MLLLWWTAPFRAAQRLLPRRNPSQPTRSQASRERGLLVCMRAVQMIRFWLRCSFYEGCVSRREGEGISFCSVGGTSARAAERDSVRSLNVPVFYAISRGSHEHGMTFRRGRNSCAQERFGRWRVPFACCVASGGFRRLPGSKGRLFMMERRSVNHAPLTKCFAPSVGRSGYKPQASSAPELNLRIIHRR